MMDTVKFIRSPMDFVSDARKEKGSFEAVLFGKDIFFLTKYKQIERMMTSPGWCDFEMGYDEFIGNVYGVSNMLTTNDKKLWGKLRDTYHDSFEPSQFHSSIEKLVKEAFEEQDLNHWRGDLYALTKAIVFKVLMSLFAPRLEEEQHHGWERCQSRLLNAIPTLDNLGVPVRYLMIFFNQFRSGMQAKTKMKAVLKNEQGLVDHESEHLILFTSSLVVKSIASVISCFFYELYEESNAEVQEKIQRELRSGISPSNCDVLQQAMKETLRYHPPILGGIRRAGKDMRFDDHDLHAGQRVWYAIPHANRDQDVYGQDAGVFNPNRWNVPIKDNGNKVELPEPLTFGLGGRKCVGKEFTMHLIQTIIHYLIDHFDIRKIGTSGKFHYLPVRKPPGIYRLTKRCNRRVN